MTQKIENEQLVDLISSIKHISLNHQDLMDVSLEYSDIYFKKNKENEEEFDKYWNNPLFLEQTVLVAREGVVLGMQAITLSEDLPFKDVVKQCVDLTQQRENEKIICQDNKSDIQDVNDFLTFLRKELFSRIFSQNKNLQKVSKIPKPVLKSRYDYFMSQNF